MRPARPASVEGAGPAPVDRVARWLTDILAPAHLAMVTVLMVAVTEAGVARGLVWAAVTILFAPGIPLAVLVFGVRQHWWSDIHLRDRRQRLVPLTVAVLSVLAGLVVLAAAGAPANLSALVLSLTAGLVVTLAVTLVWKMSVHAAVAAGSCVVFALQLGPTWGLTGAAATIAVSWSRCRLQDHTLAQVLAGIAVRAAVAAAVYRTLAG